MEAEIHICHRNEGWRKQRERIAKISMGSKFQNHPLLCIVLQEQCYIHKTLHFLKHILPFQREPALLEVEAESSDFKLNLLLQGDVGATHTTPYTPGKIPLQDGHSDWHRREVRL